MRKFRMLPSITKQVIVVRADLGMSPGKMCAQAAHASMAFITRNLSFNSAAADCVSGDPMWPHSWELDFESTNDSADVKDWLDNSFAKIVLFVDSLGELERIEKAASASSLLCYSVVDNGKTEFDGVPTKTCLAIGPHDIADFAGLTDNLRTAP